jgi:hypothetical protein
MTTASKSPKSHTPENPGERESGARGDVERTMWARGGFQRSRGEQAPALIETAIERLGTRDLHARRLMTRHLYPWVVEAARWCFPDADSEPEFIECVMTTLLRSMKTPPHPCEGKTWIRRRTIAICLELLDGGWRMPGALHGQDRCGVDVGQARTLGGGPAAPGRWTAGSARELFRQVMSGLQPRDRLVLTLLHLEGEDVPGIARLTGWPGWLVRLRGWWAGRKARRRLERFLA